MHLLYESFERIEMLGKRTLSLLGGMIRRERFFADEFLSHFDVVVLFEHGNVRCKVAVGEVQRALERIEIDAVVDHEYRHDRKADAVLENLVQMVDEFFHFSYFMYMRIPYTMCSPPKPIAQNMSECSSEKIEQMPRMSSAYAK